MRDFLNTYISTLSTRSGTEIERLLTVSKADKSQLDGLINRLIDMREAAPLAIAPEGFNGLVSNSKIDGAYKDTILALNDMYQMSNLISLLLDSHTQVLTSEIKSIEDELVAMEKAVDNFSFTLAENGSYDFAFIETFNSDVFRSDSELSLTDRSGKDFKDFERCFVNTASGTLTLSPGLETVAPLNGSVVSSNCAPYITNESNINSALNSQINSGWRVSVEAPRPVSAPLFGDAAHGVEFEVEFEASESIAADAILITPFSDLPFEILSLDIYSEEEELLYSVVDTPTTIDAPRTFTFPSDNIFKIKMFVGQKNYHRGKTPPAPSESGHQRFYAQVKKQSFQADSSIPGFNTVHHKDSKALNVTIHGVLKRHLKSSQKKLFRAQAPQLNFSTQRGPLSAFEIKNRELTNFNGDSWSNKSIINSMFRRMVHEKLFSSSPELLSNRFVVGSRASFLKGGDSFDHGSMNQVKNKEAPTDVRVEPEILYPDSQGGGEFLNYHYDLGFRNVQLGSSQKIYRGVYVTSTLPAPSDSGEVRLKADDVNYILINTSRDSELVTSIEYSITNKSDPSREVDWIPILPTNLDKIIDGERLFFDESGVSHFRFTASRQGEVTIYKNGYGLSMDNISLIDASGGEAFLGVKIPIRYIGPNDIFTVSYSTYGNQSTINFSKKGFGTTNLASAFDSEGAGQTFYGTHFGRVVDLSYDPYVNAQQIKLFGSYSTQLGFEGSYQPVTVVMADGSIAINHTNYLGIIQNDLSQLLDTETSFIHSGKELIFNKPITERFTVYYQYLPSNIKLRIVMRVNDIQYVSPFVNTVQIKTKTRKADPKKDLK